MTKKCVYTFRLGDPARFPPELSEIMKAHDIELRVNMFGRTHTEEELVAELADVDAVLAGIDPYTARVMDSAKKLKIIARIGAGYDTVDIAAATRRGIYVTYTPIPELSRAVADETFALMLSVSRKIPLMNHHVREGGFDIEGMCSIARDIYPLTLGIIGLGHIGTEVAKRARCFGMKVFYHDKIRRQDLEKELDLQYMALEKLLSSSDIVTIHTSLNPETRGMIGQREISLMKKDAVIINTARGPIIQEKPLYEALVEGRLGGAGLSVLSEEPPTPKCPFYKLGDRLPNVVLTPHVGAAINTRTIQSLAAAEEVIAVLEGRQPKYLLNKELLAS